MTTDKARKRAVRTRMTKTGESYTAARRNVIKEPAPPTPLPPRQAEPGVSDEAMRRATGRGWDDWFRILDARGIEGFSHTATAAWVATEHGIDGWWAQQVTVGYERVRGLRRRHQTSDGFEVSVSKTLGRDVHRMWSAFADDGARSAWQVPAVLRRRTAVEDKSVRFDYGDDGSRVLVSIVPKGSERATVTITHERMAGPDDVVRMRAFWRAQVEALENWLEADNAPSAG
jgi:hypothetical protein